MIQLTPQMRILPAVEPAARLNAGRGMQRAHSRVVGDAGRNRTVGAGRGRMNYEL
jgi:hypothetical protein